MSNPDDVPPQRPGAFPPQDNSVPPASSGAQPNPPAPEGYQTPPQEHQAPGRPGHDQVPPGYRVPAGYEAPPPASGAFGPPPSEGAAGGPGGPGPGGIMRFAMPADRPRNFNDVLPQGGFSGMFTVTGMPTELKVSYWIWLIGGLLGLLGGVIGVFGSIVIFAIIPGLGVLVLLLVLAALILAAAQIILAMKMKEGREWARFALTVVAGISLVLAILNASVADGRGGGGWPGFLVSLAAVVLMWMPNSQAWFAGLRGRAL